jgi:hypothetical protein
MCQAESTLGLWYEDTTEREPCMARFPFIRDWIPGWSDIKRTPALVLLEKTVTYVVALMGGWITAEVVSPATRLGYALVFLGFAFGLAVLYGVVGWARGRNRLAPPSESLKNEGAKPQILIGFAGASSSNPFRFTKLGLDEQGRQIEAEELVLRLRAATKLENVDVLIQASTRQRPPLNASLKIGPSFRGKVNPDAQADVIILRREFSYVVAQYTNAGTAIPENFTVRRETAMKLFPGTDDERLINSGAVIDVEIVAQHLDGPQPNARFVLYTYKIWHPETLLGHEENISSVW